MRIVSNTAITLDGRINTAEDKGIILGTKKDHQLMSLLRSRADAVLIGGATYRHWPRPIYPLAPEHAEQAKTPLLNVIVTRRLDMQPSDESLREPRCTTLFLAPAASARADFSAPIEYYDGPEPNIPISWIVKLLAQRGVQNLLVEAGGDLLYQFLAADALHEMFVTLCPKLIGGRNAPTLVDGLGFTRDQMKRLHLLSAEVIGDEIFLHYSVQQGSGLFSLESIGL